MDGETEQAPGPNDGAASGPAPTPSTRPKKTRATKPETKFTRVLGIVEGCTAEEPYIVNYRWRRYRFLLDDGRTVDVSAISDDSDVRGMVLEWTGADRIAGVTELVTDE